MPQNKEMNRHILVNTLNALTHGSLRVRTDRCPARFIQEIAAHGAQKTNQDIRRLYTSHGGNLAAVIAASVLDISEMEDLSGLHGDELSDRMDQAIAESLGLSAEEAQTLLLRGPMSRQLREKIQHGDLRFGHASQVLKHLMRTEELNWEISIPKSVHETTRRIHADLLPGSESAETDRFQRAYADQIEPDVKERLNQFWEVFDYRIEGGCGLHALVQRSPTSPAAWENLTRPLNLRQALDILELETRAIAQERSHPNDLPGHPNRHELGQHAAATLAITRMYTDGETLYGVVSDGPDYALLTKNRDSDDRPVFEWETP